MSASTCIICQDIGPEPLRKNRLCTCKYTTHNTCWAEYAKLATKEGGKLRCPMCRKECVEAAKPLLPGHEGGRGQQLSYEEFCEEVQLQIAIHESAAESQGGTVQEWDQSQAQTPNKKKSIYVGILVCTIVAILLTYIIITSSTFG